MTTKHYVIFTDTNSRQYPMEVPPEGLSVLSSENNFVITVDEPNINALLGLFEYGSSFFVGGKNLFNSAHLVAVQFQSQEVE